MEKFATTDELKQAIIILEAEHDAVGRELKEQYNLTTQTVIPAIKRTFIVYKAVEIGVRLASGYFSRKSAANASSGILKNIFGSVLQYGITNVLLRNSRTIDSLGNILQRYVFKKRTKKFENSESELQSAF